ncbi:glycosyltransferase family A protein [Planococcus sp. CAU13]|uniref:glycosyltransferase family A protein n=1 Tax=Planococcus sp. CAU13 TaxID=1541197 RepID=UPI000530053D|nr:glycosyltransferase family A protein [Planococcus sp. CAU13]
MNLQVLVSTMHQKDYNLVEKMNLSTEAIIVNQCEKYEVKEFIFKENIIKFLSFAERGVGLSRNNALMRASADICLFADDDVVYVEGYEKIILDAFKKQPDADMIVFNVPSKNFLRQSKKIEKNKRVRWFNCLRYGTYRMAIKTESLKKENLYFSLLFGGGAKYGSGEDSLFIFNAIKKGLKVYSNSSTIGEVSQEDSTWFNGYTDKYFHDKGALYASLFKKKSIVFALQFALRHKNKYKKEKSWFEAYKLMVRGIKEMK